MITPCSTASGDRTLTLLCPHIDVPPLNVPFVVAVLHGYLLEPVTRAHERTVCGCQGFARLDASRHETKSLRAQHQCLVDYAGRAWSEKLSALDEDCGPWLRVGDWCKFFPEWSAFVEGVCSFYGVDRIVFVKDNNPEWQIVERILRHERVRFRGQDSPPALDASPPVE